MFELDHLDFALLLVLSTLAALLALALVAWIVVHVLPLPPAPQAPSAAEGDEVGFFFTNGMLTDTTVSARFVLDDIDFDGTEWHRLHRALAPRFPDFPRAIPTPGTYHVAPTLEDEESRIEIQVTDGTARVTVKEEMPAHAGHLHALRSARAGQQRLESVLARAPFPIWATTAQNELVWTNTAFDDLCSGPGQRTAELLDPGLPLPSGEEQTTTRVRLPDELSDGSEARWFDVTVVPTDLAWLHYAVDVSEVVRAEIAQRDFVQTLTKTFALLSVGLAIFNRDRRLTLFNPALIDLSGLGPEFLSGRPDLASFFDALRERQVMPEPKNYIGWREAMNDLAARAADGNYEETWTMPAGLTYRITGRPYPNGAIAFLFEDISPEIQMSERFHQVMQLSQSVLDSLEDGVVLFSRQGRVTHCNQTYRDLWNLGPDDPIEEVTVREATLRWQEIAGAHPAWGDLRDFVSALGPRCEWQADARMPDGRLMSCRFAPVADGATLASFRLSPAMATAGEKTTA